MKKKTKTKDREYYPRWVTSKFLNTRHGIFLLSVFKTGVNLYIYDVVAIALTPWHWYTTRIGMLRKLKKQLNIDSHIIKKSIFNYPCMVIDSFDSEKDATSYLNLLTKIIM